LSGADLRRVRDELSQDGRVAAEFQQMVLRQPQWVQEPILNFVAGEFARSYQNVTSQARTYYETAAQCCELDDSEDAQDLKRLLREYRSDLRRIERIASDIESDTNRLVLCFHTRDFNSIVRFSSSLERDISRFTAKYAALDPLIGKVTERLDRIELIARAGKEEALSLRHRAEQRQDFFIGVFSNMSLLILSTAAYMASGAIVVPAAIGLCFGAASGALVHRVVTASAVQAASASPVASDRTFATVGASLVFVMTWIGSANRDLLKRFLRHLWEREIQYHGQAAADMSEMEACVCALAHELRSIRNGSQELQGAFDAVHETLQDLRDFAAEEDARGPPEGEVARLDSANRVEQMRFVVEELQQNVSGALAAIHGLQRHALEPTSGDAELAAEASGEERWIEADAVRGWGGAHGLVGGPVPDPPLALVA